MLVPWHGSLFIWLLMFTLDLGTLDMDYICYRLHLLRITMNFSYGLPVMYAASLLVDIIIYFTLVHAMSTVVFKMVQPPLKLSVLASLILILTISVILLKN